MALELFKPLLFARNSLTASTQYADIRKAKKPTRALFNTKVGRYSYVHIYKENHITTKKKGIYLILEVLMLKTMVFLQFTKNSHQSLLSYSGRPHPYENLGSLDSLNRTSIYSNNIGKAWKKM